MKKYILLNLEGVKALSKMEQKSVFGGGDGCASQAEEDLCKTLGICAPGCGPFYIV